MTELKKWITTALLTLLLLPAMAQQKADTTYTFRFVPQKDMFYVPWNGNDMELARLLECIESNKADILDGKLPLYVDGYCHAAGTVSGPDGATGGVAGRNFKDSMFGGGIITACYWGGNGQEQGIGEDQVGTGETTKVDGTDVTWRSAMTSMNEALQSAGSAWSYTIGEDFLPTLEQGQQ